MAAKDMPCFPGLMLTTSVQALDMRDIFLEQLIKNFNPKRIDKPTSIDSGSALPLEEAVQIIQNNERGRQARELARVKLVNKKQRQLADRRNRTGVALTHDMAVTKIQSALRGMLWRRRIQAEAEAVRYSNMHDWLFCVCSCEGGELGNNLVLLRII